MTNVAIVITKKNLKHFGDLLAWAARAGSCETCKTVVAAALTDAKDQKKTLRVLLDVSLAECDNPDCRARFLRAADMPQRIEEQDGNLW